MRYHSRHLLVAALSTALTMAALPVLADVIRGFSVTTTSTTPFSGTAPSSTACDFNRTSAANTTGLRLSECSAYYVCLYAASAQTLSGAGTVQAYFYDEALSAWTRESGADEAVPSGASGNRYFCFTQRAVQRGSSGCGFWVPSAVTTSGGTTVTTVARCLN